ncbi:hypothetical protein OEZ49_20140 [Ruegeria sp. WL0004]|uniref:Uncharacterized protein n=1 Tax=Ruegeria marisflavi TaxID=2984152 RepID=A0ABT2WVY7_9RHOB|nr:hypothetical protein [Ruegeria sp. WL0004]MCU9840081.1 hypothetical protein [Ruegeria sp. WL0004]
MAQSRKSKNKMRFVTYKRVGYDHSVMSKSLPQIDFEIVAPSSDKMNPEERRRAIDDIADEVEKRFKGTMRLLA